MASSNNTNTKLTVGLEMLRDARDGEFSDASATLGKLLRNVIAAPAEPKYRRIRTSNAKINMLLQTRGVRAVLIGAGFVEEGGEFLVLPEVAPLDAVQAALDGLAAEV